MDVERRLVWIGNYIFLVLRSCRSFACIVVIFFCALALFVPACVVFMATSRGEGCGFFQPGEEEAQNKAANSNDSGPAAMPATATDPTCFWRTGKL